MKKNFSKLDLRTGMIVETRDGGVYTVYMQACSKEIKGEDVIIGSSDGWQTLDIFTLDLFNERLEYLITRKLDIIKVYLPNTIGDIVKSYKNITLLWEKKDTVKEMTIKEIEEKLGYSIKIIKEN